MFDSRRNATVFFLTEKDKALLETSVWPEGTVGPF